MKIFILSFLICTDVSCFQVAQVFDSLEGCKQGLKNNENRKDVDIAAACTPMVRRIQE